MACSDIRLNSREWRALKEWVLDRDRHVCQMRGPRCTTIATCVDHIIARTDGGNMWDPTNLRAACRPCNSGGGAEITNRRRARYRTGVAEYETRW